MQMYHSILDNPEGKCFDDILSRASRKDYANRKIEDIKKSAQKSPPITTD
jgi:hypothetical protein